ncbi:hypothetical protein ACP4OV_025539 [Aristida adscensionis]
MHGVCSASLPFIDGHYSRGERSKEEAREKRGESSISSPPLSPYPYDAADADADAQAPDLAGRARARTMSSGPSPSSSSKPPPHLHLHVDTATAASPSSGNNPHRSSPRPPAGAGAGAGGQNQACAACKYQRRKCNPDCPLARYFPADQQRVFLNAHRLFGVSNIQKTLRRIEPERGPDAMRALIYQSEARAADPVHGCVRIIKDLEHQLHHTNAELAATLQQIAIYRQAAAAGDPLVVDPAMLVVAGAGAEAPGQDSGGVIPMDALYGGAEQEPVSAGAGGVFFHDQQQEYHLLKPDDDDQEHPPPPQQLYDYFCYDGSGGDEASSPDDAVSGGQMQYVGGYPDAAGAIKAGSPVSLGEQLEQHCRIEAAAPFVDAFDVKPHELPAAAIEHHVGADVVDPPPDEKMAAAMKHDIDERMAEPAPGTAAQCHLELGFSSSF